MTDSALHEQPVPRRHGWLPSFSVAIWLAFFLALMLSSSARVIMIAGDSDPCWHWQQGNWMLQHHAVLRTELFSYTRGGAPLIDMWWLSEIVMALAGNLLGWGGVALVAAAVCPLCVWLLHRQLLAEGDELLLSTAIALLAAWVCQMHWLARPHLATQFLVAVFAWQLRWFERGHTTTRRLLFLLPLLTALWANLHGAFVMAFVLIGIHFGGTVVSWALATADQRPTLRHRATVLVVLGLACFFASMLNPYGWNLPVQIIHYMSSPLLMGYAREYQPPNFHDPIMVPFVIEVVVAALMLFIGRPRLSETDALLLVIWFILTLHMVRNAPLFALVATPILAEHWNTCLRAASPSRFIRHYRNISAKLTSLNRMAGARGLPVLVVTVMILVVAKPQLFGGQPLLRTEYPANQYPVAAIEFLRQSPHAVRGEMFNEYAWGGYFTLAMPERKVFIHPNLNVYGEEVTRDYVHVNFLHPGWEHVLEKYHIDWTIMPREHPLNRALAQRAEWRLVYTDPVSSIYGRKQ
jgi:hypothetical protein